MEKELILCDTKSQIAATAITFNFKLFTYNLKDFKFLPEIQLYNL